jgi:outer membrane cobalamin receptor
VLSVRGGYTFLDSELLESTAPGNVVFAEGQWAFRRPRHSGFAQATLSWGRVRADLAGIFVGRFVDSDFSALEPPLVEDPGYTTWDARLECQILSHLAGVVTIENLTDHEYMEPLGYPALRRAVRAGIRVDF